MSNLFDLEPEWIERREMQLDKQQLTPTEQEAMTAGTKYGIELLRQLPTSDRLALEAHITGVLIAFWGALWGTFGTEYARGFIEAQLRGMEPDQPHERYTPPRMQ